MNLRDSILYYLSGSEDLNCFELLALCVPGANTEHYFDTTYDEFFRTLEKLESEKQIIATRNPITYMGEHPKGLHPRVVFFPIDRKGYQFPEC